ncbi:TonB-dependent siderophore receptor [Methylomonas sp. 11b]|uniref:TonB-dependent siderophore receptor n=1 Tax=Methylomonas sp. 11b TaxID=1168169 RepID=UPI00047BB10F|nr:TonB-dependent receptor [Methylomonas sp. 11b]
MKPPHLPPPCALRKLSIAIALSLPGLISIPAQAAETVASQQGSQRFNIPAQPLTDAINAFISSSDWQVGYPADLAKNCLSSNLNGYFTPQQALHILLQGTGLNYRMTGDNKATLEKVAVSEPQSATTMPAVTVTGKAVYDSTDPYNPDYNRTSASTATKTDTPIMETPFSVQIVPKQVLEDQQAVRLKDALKNVSGVMPGGEQGRSDEFIIRGFRNNTIYRNGVLSPALGQRVGMNRRETANLERVEVLKGPGSILYGRAEPGGIMNVVTKQPLATPYYSLQQQFGSFDFYRTTLDATGPITKNDSLLYRFNFAYQDSKSFREFVGDERVFAAPVLRWNIDPRTQVTFEFEYLKDDYSLEPGIPNVGNRPAPLPRERNLSEPYTKRSKEFMLASMNWSHEFNDNWTLRHRFSYENFENQHTGLFFLGNVSANGTINRRFFVDNFPSQRYFNNVDLTGKFETFGFKHTLLLGGDYFRADDQITQIGVAAPAINIYNPVHSPLPPLPAPTFGDKTTAWYGLFLQDQIELPFNVHVLGGLRYDNATVDNNLLGRTVSDDDRVSPRGGVLWRPLKWLSLYGSYTENFSQSNSQFRTDGVILPPETAQQWETGVKTEFWDGRLSATLAYFDLTKQNVPVFDPLNPLVPKTAGEAESRGLEFDLSGEVLPGWRIIGAYSYLPFAKITKDVAAGEGIGNTGKRLVLDPRHFGSLWNTYEFQTGDLQGLKFGAGVTAVGQRQGDTANTYQLPGYATLNLMASYSMSINSAKLTAQVNADNLLDKHYFAASNDGNQIFYGAPRTFMGSIRVEY